MRKTMLLGMVCMTLGTGALAACGSSTGTGTGGTGGGGAGGGTSSSTSESASSSSSSTSASSSSSTTSSSSSSTSGGVNVNGCDPATAEDHTADATVTIKFGGNEGLKYNPPCITIKTGTSVTFEGTFGGHPLAGGNAGQPDATSPITSTTSGTTATFTFPTAGSFPYYCTAHFSSGMQGAIFVQ